MAESDYVAAQEAIRQVAERLWQFEGDQAEQVVHSFDTAPSNARYLALANVAYSTLVTSAYADLLRRVNATVEMDPIVLARALYDAQGQALNSLFPDDSSVDRPTWDLLDPHSRAARELQAMAFLAAGWRAIPPEEES